MTLLHEIAAASQRVAQTASRLVKVREIAACLRMLEHEEIPVGVAYLSGEIRQGKLGVTYASIYAADAASAAPAPSITVLETDRVFGELAVIKGTGANVRRTEKLHALFARATADEQDFLARLIAGELRQGALRALVIEALAAATGVPLADVRRASMSAGGIGGVAQALLREGSAGLARFTVQLMQPVLPMLSQSAADVDTALSELGTAAFEWKLDGARVQVHKSRSDVRVYTRSLNDVTTRVPEIVKVVAASPRRALILDGEAIALRRDGTPHSFQLTMRRFGRKLDVEAMQRELPLSVYFFDCLLADDEVMVERSATERFRALADALPEAVIIPRMVTSEAGVAHRFFEQALARGHEGVMVKALDAQYEAGRRGAGWLKVKRANTLDLIVLAAEWGHGRRSGRLSNLHLGARDPAGGFVMLGKTFKGLTDEMLEWQTLELAKLETHRDDWTVHVRPELVVEIAFNEIQQSSRYPGGLALRFARVKGYRPDKSAAEADTIDTVRALYAAQVHAIR